MRFLQKGLMYFHTFISSIVILANPDPSFSFQVDIHANVLLLHWIFFFSLQSYIREARYLSFLNSKSDLFWLIW